MIKTIKIIPILIAFLTCSCQSSVPSQAKIKVSHVIVYRLKNNLVFREDLIMYNGELFPYESVNTTLGCDSEEMESLLNALPKDNAVPFSLKKLSRKNKKYKSTRLNDIPCFEGKEDIKIYIRTFELSNIIVYDCDVPLSRLSYSYLKNCNNFSRKVIMLYD